MGINRRPSIRDYWSKSELMYNKFYHTMFPRDRFEIIYHTMLHCSDSASENKDKIEPYMNLLIENFNQAFYPYENLSIDEMVIGFTGRWKYKQYNSSKPKKYHIKTFGLVDATTGYVLNILTYFGASTSYDPAADTNSGMAVKLFDTLLRHVGTGHHIFADRHYTTAELVRHIGERTVLHRNTQYKQKRFSTTAENTVFEAHGITEFLGHWQ
ncbi:hypothetical protein BsWGS_24136 [Bradybaena similaris]